MRRLLRDIFLIMAGTMAYGFVLGWWRSPLMAVYVAAKLPIVFAGSAMMVSVFGWMAARFLGSDMTYDNMLGQAFCAMAVSSSVLLSLAPVAMFMVVTGAPDIVLGSPDADVRAGMRFAHSALMLMHMFVLACAGTVGVVRLHANLRENNLDRRRLAKMLVCWLVAFAVVGCQTGWILRPLVGSPNIKVEFLRKDAIERNFLESVFTQLIPHFVNKGRIPHKERYNDEQENTEQRQ